MGLALSLLCSCQTLNSVAPVSSVPESKPTGAVEKIFTATPDVSIDARIPRTRFQLEDRSSVSSELQIRQVVYTEPGRLTALSHGQRTSTGQPCPACGAVNCQQHVRLPDTAYYTQWPAAARPKDEFLFDGGDRLEAVRLDRDGLYQGFDMEDTIASFRTRDGSLKVEASNRVSIYAPRFGSVRKISGVTIHQQHLVASTMKENIRLAQQNSRLEAEMIRQRDELVSGRGLRAASAIYSRWGAAFAQHAVRLGGVQLDLLPYENNLFIRAGTFEESEKPKLSRLIESAFAWSSDEGLQVASKGFQLHDATAATTTGNFHVYNMPEGKPRLRIVKLASTDNALPGETVDFTIRFDNLGDQSLDEVAIADNLTPRLELVADSVKCSVDAEFSVMTNAGDSLMLRWVLSKPLEVNEGGIIHFRCLVR
jgi:uncharacterized repeat protein (TIGR01451 family)